MLKPISVLFIMSMCLSFSKNSYSTNITNPIASPQSDDEAFCINPSDEKSPCVHAHFDNPKHIENPVNVNTKSFLIHIETPNDAQGNSTRVSDVKVLLWKKTRNNHILHSTQAKSDSNTENIYQVTQARFTFSGSWLILVTFKFNNTDYQINVPVEVSTK